MPTLKESLGGMAAINQFIVWKLTWDDAENKYKKVPINVNNPEHPSSGADPANWLPFDLALQWVDHLTAKGGTYALGFYFTRDCGYWFFDMDNAVEEGQLNPTATAIYTVLAGAGCAFEWSSSGRGFHMFGRGTLREDRQIKPFGTGLELYTEGRGVAFGLTGEAIGCADADATAAMNDTIIPTYFPPKAAGTNLDDSDFSKPRDDYHCESNDDELLQRMLRSGSIESKFNVNKPIFSDYWNGNLTLLETYYKGDRSSIDAGLASHLAYWTGCHAPRMITFMRNSELVRPKWEREDYLERTVKAACIQQGNVLQDKPTLVVTDVLEGSEVVDEEDTSTVLSGSQQLKLFKDCVYITSIHEIYKPLKSGEFRTLNDRQFNALFAKFTFKLDLKNEAGSYSKKAFEAFLKTQLCEFPKVDDIRFDPTQPPKTIFTKLGNRYLNTYDPVHIDRCKGDVSLFTDLIRKNFPDGDDSVILTSWMAACIQYPGQKFMWAPVLQGGQGIGKTTITECLKYAVGRQFTVTPKASELGAKFNAWIERALLVIINEMKQDKETEGEVKKLVTDIDVIIEAKGRDQHMATNYANFIFTLNDKWDFKKARGDRRFCVMYSALQELDDIAAAGLTEEHFNRIQNWLRHEDGYAKVTEYLATYEIPDRYNPATKCVRAPDSSSEPEVYENSRHYIEAALREAVEDERAGFKGGFISLTKAMLLFPNLKDARVLRRHLLNMGYSVHPILSQGKLSKILIEEDSARIKVYCSKDLIVKTRDMFATELTELYRKSQYL